MRSYKTVNELSGKYAIRTCDQRSPRTVYYVMLIHQLQDFHKLTPNRERECATFWIIQTLEVRLYRATVADS